jgi:hypothetical protein
MILHVYGTEYYEEASNKVTSGSAAKYRGRERVKQTCVNRRVS